ncbi:alcohol dehydrogenase catalytic domain-containing protein [Rhodococcus globerulus]|uniref:alcohol dehydrogenase catalytic domain-containing protein n=1 Tax=Rhodococcus globerulus TaxID=33008 RepID=UPI00301AD077
MRAAVLRGGDVILADIPEPSPGPNQLLVEPIATGICGSDLSAWQHTDDFLAAHREADVPGALFDPAHDLVFGHEFTATVTEVGTGVVDYAVGDRLVVLPWVVDDDGLTHTVGYCNSKPGGLAERVVIQAGGHLHIPPDVDPVTAAVTEPLATGVNAVLRSRIVAGAAAVVTGCGPVGLGAVIELAERGIHPIVVSDPSELRRTVALAYGADVAVDPRHSDPLSTLAGMIPSDTEVFVFEASGARNLLGSLMSVVPPFTRIVIVGSAMQHESIRPVIGILKNVSLEFVGGPGRGEPTYQAFSRTFEHIVERRFDPGLMVTGFAGLDAVSEVFSALRPAAGDEIEHVKVLVRPDLPAGAGVVRCVVE